MFSQLQSQLTLKIESTGLSSKHTSYTYQAYPTISRCTVVSLPQIMSTMTQNLPMLLNNSRH